MTYMLPFYISGLFAAMANTVGHHDPDDILLLQAGHILDMISYTGASVLVFG